MNKKTTDWETTDNRRKRLTTERGLLFVCLLSVVRPGNRSGARHA